MQEKIQLLSGKFGVARAYAQAALDILGQFCAHAFSAFMERPKNNKNR